MSYEEEEQIFKTFYENAKRGNDRNIRNKESLSGKS